MPYIIEKTFNSEIFTKVGNPTITNDGVASGFSSYSFLQISINLSNKPFIFETPKFVYSQVASDRQYLFNYGSYNTNLFMQAFITSTGVLNTSMRNNSTDIFYKSYQLILNNSYQIKYVLNNTEASIYLKTNDNDYELWYTTTNTSLYTVNNTNMRIGQEYNGSTRFYLGSIYLKQFKITVDGKEVFSGSKSTPTFDRSKFTVVGSPTITDDGIASGFSDENYLTGSFTATTPKKEYIVRLKIKLNSIPTSTNRLWTLKNTDNCFIALYNNDIACRLDGDFNLISVEKGIDINWDINQDIYISMRVTASKTYLTVECNGDSITKEANTNSRFISMNTFDLGGIYAFFTSGSIDLKQFGITVDSNEVFSGSKSTPTFDRSKFTVVGSPTITDDGIASGFSSSNYLTGSFTSVTPSKIIFRTKGVYSSTPNAANGSQVLGRIQGANSNPSIEYYSNANRLSAVRFHNNSNSDNRSAQINISLQDGDIVEAEVIATSSFVTLNAKINGVPYTNTWSGNGLYCGAINGCLISNNSNWYWTGSVDLKQFSITVDGKVVLNGTTSKEVYVLPSIQEIKDYYSNTLIIQYNGKPKAKATIEMLVDLIYDDVILNQIQEAFDWKTAVGKQLDIIGQWVGVSRIYQQYKISGKTYLSYPGWDDETDPLQHGYSNYATFDTDTGNDLTYKELETLEANLNDDDYRTVIGLKIIKNNINHTAKNIDNAIWEYFNGQVYTTWSNYEITYHYPAELTTIIEVCNAENVLLAPIGINIKLLQTE